MTSFPIYFYYQQLFNDSVFLSGIFKIKETNSITDNSYENSNSRNRKRTIH